MKSLFIIRRPGIIVMSGQIKEMGADYVVLENSFRNKTIQATIYFRPSVLQKLGVTIGATVIASTKDDFQVEMMLEGAEFEHPNIKVQGYTIRYNGSFDFEQHGNNKECHIFSGTLLSAKSGAKDGYTWNKGIIAWKKNLEEQKRNIVWWNQTGESLENYIGKRVILVAGEAKTTGSVSYYNVTDVYSV